MDKKPNSTPDHDLLITLNTKVDQLTSDLRDLKDNLLSRIIRAETRLDSMDVYHAAIPLKDYDDIARWTQSFRSNIKFIAPLLLALVSVAAGLIARVMQVWLKL
jgi:hypothetical protein